MFLSRIRPPIAALFAVLLVCLVPSVAAAQTDADFLLSADGAGKAKLGLSPEALAEQLGADYEFSSEVRITVDFTGRVISRDGEVQFRAAMADDSDLLTLFIVSNADYTTAEGVGPSMRISDAEAIYGEATLSWNPDDEGREFVRFANGPTGRIMFRTPGIGGSNVGIYPDGQFETTEYDADGTIAAVWISCIPGTDCPADRAAATPTPTPAPTATAAPAPEPTPTPAAAAGSGSGSGSGQDLPQTGSTELALLAVTAVLFSVGGACVLLARPSDESGDFVVIENM